MGLKFVGKGSVVVDCRAAQRNGKQWTLVNNSTMERMYCQIGSDVVEKLMGDCPSVQDYIDKLRKADEKKRDDGYSERICFVSIDDAPVLLNLIDASDHVKEWDATRNGVLSVGERTIVRIDYTSDRQLLFQEGDKVVFRDEDPSTPKDAEHDGEGTRGSAQNQVR